jgi:glycosyltransferase involved in cell wall biosynthesis
VNFVLVCESVFPEKKGGLERWMMWLATNLVQSGHFVTFLHSSGMTENRKGVSLVPVTKKPWHYVKDGKRSINQSIFFSLKLAQKLRSYRADVIYSVQAPILSIFVLAMFQRKSLLIVEWIEIWSLSYWRRYLGTIGGTVGFLVQQKALRMGNIRVTFTSACFNSLPQTSKSRKMLLPGLCMDLEPVDFPIAGLRTDILFIGRFVAEKQPMLAVEAIHRLKQTGWTGTFYMIGTGPLKDELVAHVREKNALNYISIVENPSDNEVKSLLSQAFALIHPSRREGFGLAMFEAASQGTPTVLIRYPDNRAIDLAIIPDLIAETDSPEELARLLRYAHENQEKFRGELIKWATRDLPKISAQKTLQLLLSEIEHAHNSLNK